MRAAWMEQVCRERKVVACFEYGLLGLILEWKFKGVRCADMYYMGLDAENKIYHKNLRSNGFLAQVLYTAYNASSAIPFIHLSRTVFP